MNQLALHLTAREPPPPQQHSSQASPQDTTSRYTIETIRVQLNASEPLPTEIVGTTNQAIAVLHRLFATLEPDQEHFLILALNAKLAILSYKLISSGGQSGAIVDAKLVFRHALLMGASRIILSHSHPSGNPTPSPEDLQITEHLTYAGRHVEIPVIDHIIIAPPDGSYSFAQSGCLPK